MGLLQKAVETYEAHEELAGKYIEGKIPLAPISHNTTKAQIEITIDVDGNFIKAESIDKKSPPIIIPVTEESANRVGSKPHPLCDQLKYFLPENESIYKEYLENLRSWLEYDENPLVKAVFNYISRGTIIEDLINSEIVKIKQDGTFDYKEKDMVIFAVVGSGSDDGRVWRSKSLMHSFDRFTEIMNSSIDKVGCYISGEYTTPSFKCLKGVVPLYGNAKIISSNDSVNFTYRGRFTDPEQAVTVGYKSAQMSHNALKWLSANQGVIIGGRTFLCWNPKGYELPDIFDPLADKEDEKTVEPTKYAEQISRILLGFKANIPEDQGAVIASFDAATTGRLSLTYYSELLASDLIERIAHWDRTSCFCGWYYGQYGISAPDLRNIIRYAFGTQRGDDNNARIECDDKIMRQHVQRLLSCRVDGAKFPFDIMAALVKNASNPLAYNTQNRNTVNFISCAIIRKYKYDNFKEEWEMALEPEKRDLSYQYGRLLAVMEKAERDTYDSSESREPNAIRMQSVFCQRPAYAAKTVIEQLKKSYLPRLSPALRTYYDKLIGQIFEQISIFPDSEHNRALKETYLLGYYLQKNALYSKREKTDDAN